MAESPNNALPITGASVPIVDIEIPIRSVKSRVCDDYSREYLTAAKAAEDVTETNLAKLYRSLGILCSFFPNYQDVADPYRPVMIWEGKRSPVPDDLSDDDLNTVATLFAKATDPALRARLGDILWVRRRDHKAAKQAVDDYIAAATRLLTAEDWTHSIELFHRALQLAAALGRQNEAWQRAEAALVSALGNPLAQSAGFYACYLLEVAERMRAGDPMALAKIAKEQADKAVREKDAHRSREYRLLEADFLKATKDANSEAASRLAAAETYVEEAEACLLRPQPSYLAASSFLAQGVEALRQAKADPARIKELRKRLNEYQQKSLGEMKTIRSGVIDLTKPAEQAAEFVSSPDFREALKRLALGIDPIKVQELREEVLSNAKQFPMLHLFGSSTVDSAGRVVERTGSLLGKTGSEVEQEIEAQMFQQARFHWGFRVSAFIEPARIKVWSDHHPRPSDLAFLLRHNPFVPSGHETIFIRGIFYGLAGDTLLSSHLLAPQIENSIRFVLEQNGVDVSNLQSDLTQPVKVLGPLFELPETKKIFGNDLCFELRGLLIEKSGYSFRNRVAHGFVTTTDCFGAEASNLWWLTLHLCHKAFILAEKDEEDSAATPSAMEKSNP